MARRKVQDCLLLYVQAFLVQVSQTAAAKARFSARQRLARWLLMAHDRMTGNQLPLTHEYLALMLGTRRATASTLIPELDSLGVIRNRRGRVVLASPLGARRGRWSILWHARAGVWAPHRTRASALAPGHGGPEMLPADLTDGVATQEEHARGDRDAQVLWRGPHTDRRRERWTQTPGV